MFDSISFTELITILLIALVVFGPQRLPELARKAGQWAREVRRVAGDFRRGLDEEVKAIKEPLDEAKAEFDHVADDLKAAGKEVKQSVEWVGPAPVIGPTPEEALSDKPPDEPDPPEGRSDR